MNFSIFETNVLILGALLILQVGKNMVRWLTIDILKSPHLTLATILVFEIIIKL